MVNMTLLSAHLHIYVFSLTWQTEIDVQDEKYLHIYIFSLPWQTEVHVQDNLFPKLVANPLHTVTVFLFIVISSLFPFCC